MFVNRCAYIIYFDIMYISNFTFIKTIIMLDLKNANVNIDMILVSIFGHH